MSGSIAEQTRATIANVKAILEKGDSSLDRVVKVTVYLTDMADFAEMNDEYGKHFLTKPARMTFAVKGLPRGVAIEIECIAYA